MITRAQIRGVEKHYDKAFPDKTIVDDVVEIVGEILAGQWPDDTPMGLYTVGELVRTTGFYAAPLMIADLTGAYVGRAVRASCIDLGIDPTVIGPSDRMMKFIMSRQDQETRVTPQIVARLIYAYGQPPVIDEDGVADLASRAAQLLSIPV